MKFATIALVGATAAADFKMTADDTYKLYIDGKFVGENSSWMKAHTHTYDSYVEGESVIAIKADETHGNLTSQRGIVGMMAGKPTNHKDWLCKYYPNEDPPADWKDRKFDDSQWKVPVKINVGSNYTIDERAEWFWLTADRNVASAHVYCRYGGTRGVNPELKAYLESLKEQIHTVTTSNAVLREDIKSVGNQNTDFKEKIDDMNLHSKTLDARIQEITDQYSELKSKFENMQDVEHPEALMALQEALAADLAQLHVAAGEMAEEHRRMLAMIAEEYDSITNACGEHNSDADNMVCTEIWNDKEHEHTDDTRQHYQPQPADI